MLIKTHGRQKKEFAVDLSYWERSSTKPKESQCTNYSLHHNWWQENSNFVVNLLQSWDEMCLVTCQCGIYLYECKPPFTTCPGCHVVHYVFQYLSVHVATLKAQTLSLSLNVLMLYCNMKQMAKLSMFIFALLTWADCSCEFIIKKKI